MKERKQSALRNEPSTNEDFLLSDPVQLRAIVKALTLHLEALVENPTLLLAHPQVGKALEYEATLLHATCCDACAELRRGKVEYTQYHRDQIRGLFKAYAEADDLAESESGLVEEITQSALNTALSKFFPSLN